MPPSKSQNSSPLDDIEQRKAELQAEIDKIESFIKEAPEQHQRAEEERRQTMPAPDDLAQRQREKDFQDRLTKGELKNERRHQARSAMLFLLLIVAITFVSAWIWQIIKTVEAP